MNNDPAYWEALLAAEGMAEISLFDNTGKNKSVTFLSTTCRPFSHTKEFVDPWEERVNIERFDEPVAIHDTDESAYWRLLSDAVHSLPPGWPSLERELLELYAETGFFEKARKKLGITANVAYSAKRRFEQWRKNQ